MPAWNETVITKIEQRTPSVRSYWLEWPNIEKLTYLPGQFVTLELPVGERPRDGRRSYSIAAAPDGSNSAELCIVKLPQGKGTTYLFEDADIGVAIRAKGPAGVFTLPEGPLKNDIVMICTGTGVAPFRAMLQARLATEKVNFHLIFGCRKAEDILYLDDFRRMEQQYSNFRYSVCISQIEPTSDLGVSWQMGYVHKVYTKKYSEVKDNISFYLCGWSEMVDEARDRLLNMGYKNHQIIMELYG